MIRSVSNLTITLALAFSTITAAKIDAVETLDGINGKVFHVSPSKQQFELLTETLIDPDTDEGKSRHLVQWNDKTEFVKVTRYKNFKFLEGRKKVEFYGLNKKWADAIDQGKPFRHRSVRILLPTNKRKLGLSEDRKSLVGWFTLDPKSSNFRDGFIDIKGKLIKASLPGPNGAVDVLSNTKAQDLNKGFWEARIYGQRLNGLFSASKIEIYPKTDPRNNDDPNLPRVLVIGDSISMNYHNAAKEALKGIANYYRVSGNAGPSDRGVSCIELWLGDYKQKGLHWDLIQFNHGLHDLKQFYDEETQSYGEYQISLKQYQANLEKEIAILRRTGAILMWCSTTPVPNSSTGKWDNVTMGRRKDEDLVFNKAALEIISKYPSILINDLNASIRDAVKNNDIFDKWSKGTDVHFWQNDQQKVVGEAVAKAIENALKSANTLRN